VFENRILKRTFGPKRDEITEEWRKVNNADLHNLYSLLDIIKQMKSRRMRWTGHVTRMGEGETCIGFLWEGLKGKDHSEDQGVDGRMGLE
jgi:hypothetical protein